MNTTDPTRAISKRRAHAKYRARQLEVRRNMLLLCLSIAAILFFTLWVTSISTQASDSEHQPMYKYFKSIEITAGDTLWSIAEANMDDEHYSYPSDYVAEVKRMNSLTSDRIEAGSYLIVPYYSTEFVSSQTE